MKRHLFRAQIQAGKDEMFVAEILAKAEEQESLLREHGVWTCSMYRLRCMLYLYLETDCEEFEPVWLPSLLKLLLPWPGEERPRQAVPMNDIFHDGVPVELSGWRGGRTVEDRVGYLARVKPELYSSYVFYHYQLQEEQPECFNQTYIIGSHERMIFSYSELPNRLSGRPRKGLLDTEHSPPNWQEAMDPHFDPWDDTEEAEKLWRKLERVLSFG